MMPRMEKRLFAIETEPDGSRVLVDYMDSSGEPQRRNLGLMDITAIWTADGTISVATTLPNREA